MLLRPAKGIASVCVRSRVWWNWQTRYFEVVVPQGVQVQILLSAPTFAFAQRCAADMKSFRIIRSFWLAACLGILAGSIAGCTFRYDITLQNGDVIRSKNKPKLNDRGAYVYKDVTGKEQTIPSIRVRQIEPARFGKSKPSRF